MVRSTFKNVLLTTNVSCYHLLTYSPPHYCFDLELLLGKLIPSLGGSIVSLHPPKKSYKPNSLGENYFWPRPFPYMGKMLTFDRKVVETPFWYQNDRSEILRNFDL